MIGSSRTSIALVSEAVTERYGDANLGKAGSDLLRVADLVWRDKNLRSTLGDSGRPVSERRAIIEELLAGKIDGLAVELAAVIAAQRWSSESDLVDAFEYAGAEAIFAADEKAGKLDQAERDLFRFGRVVVSNGELQLTLSSPSMSADAKLGLLRDLLSGKVDDRTIDLLAFVSAHLRGRRLDQAVDMLSDLAAKRKGELRATVTVARPLTADQETRLAAALGRIYGQDVTLNTEINPSVVGGVSVQVGDDYIDGSVANKLATARRRVAG